MAEITNWVKKIWKNRTTEFPTRRTLMKEDGSSEIVTVTRNEGTVSEEGDAFDADTMNNLEERIDAGFAEVNGKLVMKVEQKTGKYKNQKLNKQVIICSVTLTPGLWLIIGFIDGNISSDFIYNNTLFDQTVRESMIGGGGSTNIILRGIGTTTTVNLSTYDFANVTSDLTYRGTLTAICLKPYSDN